MNKRNVFVVGVLVSAGLVVGASAGSTFANRPHYQTSSKTISACRSDNDEALRIIRGDSGCKRWEQKVKWDGSQTAVVHIDEDVNAQGFLYSYTPDKSRNVIKVDRIYADDNRYPGNGFCIELPFTPLYAADKDNGHINANMNGGDLRIQCGDDTDYEAFIDGNTAGSWFFSE